MSERPLTVERHGKTALVTLNRPPCRNALNPAMAEALLDSVEALRTDASVRSVVLTGAGGAFCSGADLGGDTGCDEPAFFGRDVVLDHQRWYSRLAELEKPVIAAVDGAAVGAGFSLALAADFVFVTPRTRLLASFFSVGLVPDLSLAYTLPRRVGLAKAKEILFSARPIGAEEALASGIAQAILAPEQLLEASLAYARQFDDAPPRAIGLTKAMLNRSYETDRETMVQLEAAAQSLCSATNYHAEAIQRFLGKQGFAYAGANLPERA